MTNEFANHDAVPPPQPSPPRGGSRRIAHRICLLVLAALACTGCSWHSGGKWKFAQLHRPEFLGGKPATPDPEIPSRLVATWADTVLNKAGQPSQRGFGGRLIFFKEGSQDPIRVDGQLVVYAFDDTDRPDYETHPTRQYVFPREQLPKQESDSKLGPSYSVWLPWDEVGGPQKKISLIARFEPAGGPILLGEQTRHLLPGVAPPEQQLVADPAFGALQAAAAQPVGSVQQASYAEPASPATAERSIIAASPAPAAKPHPAEQPSMASMTIALPRRLGPALPQPAKSLREMHSMPVASIASQAPIALPQVLPTTTAGALPATATEPLVDRAQWLRDSVRATHPARATPTAPPAPGRGL